eukprot:Stramenopile-MAST_4_protein_1470
MEDDPFDDFGGDDFEAALVAAAEAVEAKKRLVVDSGSLQAQSTNKQKCVHQPSAKTVPLPRPAYVKPAPAVPAPQRFPFPYPQPYDIQTGFMRQLWDTLETGRIGIFESPTGTGKSLSMICGAVHWLLVRGEHYTQQKIRRSVLEHQEMGAAKLPAPRYPGASKPDKTLWTPMVSVDVGDRQGGISDRYLPNPGRRQRSSLLKPMRKRHTSGGQDEEEEEPDWVTDFKNKKVEQACDDINEKRSEAQAMLTKRMEKVRKRMHESRADRQQLQLKRSKKENSAEDTKGDEGDTENLVEDYVSGGEDADGSISLFGLDDSEDEEDLSLRPVLGATDEDIPAGIKILFCSRTHSQISQFINELKKTEFAEKIKIISLGSRNNLCINEKLKKKARSITRLNDGCKDLQKNSKTSKEGNCPYFDTELHKSFASLSLSKVNDIEDLVKVGRRTRTCPYYGSRESVESADIVTMPYSMLLHKKTRESLGVKLEDHIVILDEAHNVIDNINALYSCSIFSAFVVASSLQLKMYKARYEKRLNAKNLSYINQILTVLRSLEIFFEDLEKKHCKDAIFTINDFLSKVGIDDMNMIKVNRYLDKSKLCNKLHGFVVKKSAASSDIAYDTPEADQPGKLEFADQMSEALSGPVAIEISKHMSPLSMIQTFLSALLNSDSDGRVRVQSNADGTIWLKYIMLNPAIHFQSIVQESRSIILAGGTMQPVSGMIRDLLAVTPEEVDLYSCGHVVPAENLMTMVLERGPTGRPFNFTYSDRQSASQMDELGVLLVELCGLVPKGLVVFFPSYGYQDTIIEHWKKSGTLARIGSRKSLFLEPRESSQVENTLRTYKNVIDSKSAGAIMFCVVNGKMSEGINFGDDMARAVVMVGLPFANSSDSELKEKIKFLQQRYGNDQVGREYYEDLCMKAVNQSIGRAVRHIDDYAAILLVDGRYKRASIRKKLPKWMMTELKTPSMYGGSLGAASMLRRFYERLRQKYNNERI